MLWFLHSWFKASVVTSKPAEQTEFLSLTYEAGPLGWL